MAELVIDSTLDAFFEANGRKPWRPGTVDCCLFLASWAIWIGHRDPAAHLRGAYDSEAGFREIIASAGGVVQVVERCVSSIGGKPLASPVAGAIGVIGSRVNIEHQFGAIFDGSCWRVRFINCIGRMAASPLAIWEI